MAWSKNAWTSWPPSEEASDGSSGKDITGGGVVAASNPPLSNIEGLHQVEFERLKVHFAVVISCSEQAGGEVSRANASSVGSTSKEDVN